MIGETLAHYEIAALVGKGGIGEVYRSRGTKLDRDVELIEGEDLAERLAQGKPPIDEAVRVRRSSSQSTCTAALLVLGRAPSGLVETGRAQMSRLDNGVIEVGVDLGLGGAITHLSISRSDENLVNSYDYGRQIQQSYYAGNDYHPSGTVQHSSWSPWPWNPIQAGDVIGNTASALQSTNDGVEIYVKTVPMQWALNNVPGECTFETRISLEGQYWRATENWAALVDDRGWGLGVCHPGASLFVGGFAGGVHEGVPRDYPTSHVSPLHTEIIDDNVTYEYRYDLLLGDLAAIRQWAVDQQVDPRPDYRFVENRQHWH